MSFETLYPGAANLIGNVAIPRNIHPIIRASVRRLNPDLISSAPYYASATGKTLRLNYTKEVSTVVTPATVDIALSSNSLAVIISSINAADSSNIQAVDLDGFLAIRNLNSGKTHFLTIAPFSTPADDAAPILGFEVSPFPGSTSFAGEIASSPGSRSQNNPQTTTLLSKNDSLGTEELNRGFVSILQMLEDLRVELSRDVIVYKDVLLTFSSHNPGPVPAARINNDSLRLFCPSPASDPPSALTPQDLDPYFRALDSTGSGEDVVNFGTGSTDANALLVTNLYYATNVTNFISGSVFSTWGTPDGGTIVSSTTANKTKHPSTAITSIKGNIVFCTSATFVTHKVKAGDPVKLAATVIQPFDHSGWFAVDAVIDETHLAIRPMASSEEIPDGTSVRPRWLNPSAGGTLLVAVGRFIPAGDIYVTINSQLLTGNHVIRLPIGARFIDTINHDRARDLSGTLSRLGAVLQDHMTDLADRHPADAITGFTSATTWRDGTTISGANLKQTIEDVLTDLKAQAASNSGAGRVGAEVISIGGSTPNTLAQGTVLSQLTSLLTALQTHVNQASGAHAATAISYAGGPNWADATTNPATTVEAQLDKIVTDLGGTGGASKIKYDGGPAWADSTVNPATTVEGQLDKILTDLGGAGGASKIKYDGGPAWADSTTNPATTVEFQLDKILTDLGGTGGASKIKYDGGPNWADSTTNPANTVEGQLDKIITDLAASTGSAKVGGAASGTDISAGTLAAQIADLAVNWLKMSRANTISGAQTFSALLTANAGIQSTHYNLPSTVIPIPAEAWKSTAGSPTLDGGSGSGLWVFQSGISNSIVHGLILPVGTRITALKFHVNRASSSSGSIVCSLSSKILGGGNSDFGTPSGTYIGTVASGSAYTTVDLVTVAGSPFTTVSGSAYWLQIDTNLNYAGAVPQFDGVEITIDHA